MRVFLTGATGYVGSVVAEKLLEEGHFVLGLTRGKAFERIIEERGIEPFLGDLEDLDSLKNGAERTDAVIHTAFGHDFANLQKMVQNEISAVETFVGALAGGNKTFVATSAPTFLGDTGDNCADEEYPVDPDSAFVGRRFAEKTALAADGKRMRSVVLRLPFYVYGRGGSTFVPALIRMAKNNGAAYYYESGEQKVSAVHVDDLADLYVSVLGNENVHGLYNVAAEAILNKEIAEAVARLTDTKAESISSEEAKEKFGLLYDFLVINNQLCDKKVKDLGWMPDEANSILEDIENGSYRA